MRRAANSSQPTGEYQSRVEYDAGYRDGYRAAVERCANETAILRQRFDALVQSIATIAAFSPVPAVLVSGNGSRDGVCHLPTDLQDVRS